MVRFELGQNFLVSWQKACRTLQLSFLALSLGRWFAIFREVWFINLYSQRLERVKVWLCELAISWKWLTSQVGLIKATIVDNNFVPSKLLPKIAFVCNFHWASYIACKDACNVTQCKENKDCSSLPSTQTQIHTW